MGTQWPLYWNSATLGQHSVKLSHMTPWSSVCLSMVTAIGRRRVMRSALVLSRVRVMRTLHVYEYIFWFIWTLLSSVAIVIAIVKFSCHMRVGKLLAMPTPPPRLPYHLSQNGGAHRQHGFPNIAVGKGTSLDLLALIFILVEELKKA